MTILIHGRKYNFEIVSQNGRIDFCFFIRAICKSTKRTSCINNLNTILSEFNVEVDEDELAIIRSAANSCPVQIIKIED